MAKLKKVFILLAIIGLTFGYSLAGLATPQKAEAAKASDAKIAQDDSKAEVDSDVDVSDEATQNDGLGGIQTCEKPSGGSVIDGNGSGFFKTPDQISASWDGFDDHGEPITNYKYSVWKKVSGPDTKIVKWTKTNDPNIKSFTANAPFLVPLEEGGLYYTKVQAYNSCGWSKPAIKSTGQILDSTKPKIGVLSLTQDKPYGTKIDLSWTAADDSQVGITNVSGVSGYKIYRNNVLYQTVDENTFTFSDTITGNYVPFTYFIRAIDNAGNISNPSNEKSAIVDDVAPVAPNISYWIGGGNIVIFYPAVAGASDYEIYRDGTLIYSGTDLKYTDLHPTKGVTHDYVVYAIDEAGNKSGPSNTLAIYVPKPQVLSAATTGQVQGTTTPENQTQVSPSPSPSGEVQASETSQPEETAGTSKTNWSLIIAIIIAAAIVVAGILYWWYAREEEDEI